jgi:hypothetical protein
MDDGSLTDEQGQLMLELLEQAALHDYPNPQRSGCPGSEFLFRLACDRGSIDISDARLTHVARCSPCFTEFRSCRQSDYQCPS